MHCAGLKLDLRRSRHSCNVCQTALRPRRAVAGRVAKPDTQTDVVANGNGPSRAEESGAVTPVLTSRMIADITKKAPGEMRQGMAHTPHAAYQGVPGAYSESAALKACPDCVPLPCSQFENAFQALSQWMADRAVLPVENSLGGSIHAVYDLMLRYNLHIVGETSVAVNHCLMALPGTRIADLRRVMSHPQALAQCDTYIRNLGITREAVDDTAGAAQDIARHDLEAVGAIASSRAAELYNLEILDEGIQDDKSNLTRFVVLSRDPLLITDSEDGHLFKTSIVFTMPEGPGQLFRALSVFSLRDIDMTKIESRPMRENALVAGKDNIGRRFNYLFYVDFIGSMASVTCQNAMRHLNEIATFVRVLGCYPRDKF